MKFSCIAAMTKNRVIGANGTIPWKVLDDMKHFTTTTKKIGAVAMGRKTYESIGKALPGRTNIIVSSSASLHAPGCIVVPSFYHLFDIQECNEICIIGGQQLYAAMLPFCDDLYLTTINAELKGDVYFPNLEEKEWYPIGSDQTFPQNERNEYEGTIQYLRRKKRVAAYIHEPLPLLNLAHARHEDQKAYMAKIIRDGNCPFCPDQLKNNLPKGIVYETDNWVVGPNTWPYPNTRTHLLLVHRKHISRLRELSNEAWIELGEIAHWAEETLTLPGGGFVMRWGDTNYNGGTVSHIHAHIASPNLVDKSAAEYKKVSFTLA